MRIITLLLYAVVSNILCSCAALKPSAVAGKASTSDPLDFFSGKTRSSGVIENRGGKPTVRITTETMGIWKDRVLQIEQDLYPEGGKKNHRSWNLRRIDASNVEATANDIDGIARGMVSGNEVSWTFRLKLPNRKLIKHLRMSQYFYLMPDGTTMVIRSVLRKFSFIVAQITEEFKKE